jgi:hypothetical protein
VTAQGWIPVSEQLPTETAEGGNMSVRKTMSLILMALAAVSAVLTAWNSEWVSFVVPVYWFGVFLYWEIHVIGERER